MSIVTRAAERKSAPSTGEQLIAYVVSSILSVVAVLVGAVSVIFFILAAVTAVKLPLEEYRDWIRSLR